MRRFAFIIPIILLQSPNCPNPEPSPCPSATPCPVITPCPKPSPLCSDNGGPIFDCWESDNDCNYKFRQKPIPSPEPSPSITPEPSPSITPEPSPSITPEPSPSGATPFPTNCKLYKPTTTGWSILSATLNNKPVCQSGTCNKPPIMTGGPGGQVYNFKKDTVADGDSTSRYLGEVACWKTGKVERCEYPPGSACGETTTWSGSGIVIIPESNGYGAKLKFPNTGSFKLKACRKNTDLCTEKTVKVS